MVGHLTLAQAIEVRILGGEHMETIEQKKIEETLEVAHEICNEWEIRFLESVLKRVKGGTELTPKQLEITNDLYKKACDSPH